MVQIFDEMRGTDGNIRDVYIKLAHWFETTPADVLANRFTEAEAFFRRIGITFAVYGDAQGTERLIPFDIVPRTLASSEWNHLKKGLEQRVRALNRFIGDVYGNRDILRAGIIPEALVYQNPAFRPEMMQFRPAGDIYVHISGIDIVRVAADTFYVLEDNARTPSGVSYMLENREAMLRLFPELFAQHRIRPVEDYPDKLLACMRSVAPRTASKEPNVVLLTPEVNGSGGYGMLVGPHASNAEIETFRAKLKAHPEGFIAQPTLALSTVPCFVESGLAPRHVDLRPFILSGADKIEIVPGGLTRVAMKQGSLVVNSSQGGGTKDTWVME
eukprot:gene2330-2369_t